MVAEVDALQQRSGEGPCLAATRRGGTVYAEEPRWPHFAPEATDGFLGALNLYGPQPSTAAFPHPAGLALASARSHEDQARRADDLEAAVTTRELIGEAQGILMERECITADQAFSLLRRASQHLNLKLREVAREVVETGENPPSPPPQP